MRVEVTVLNVTTRMMTECSHDHKLQLQGDLARLPVLGLEHVALLLRLRDEGVEARPPPGPRHAVPEGFAGFVIFKLSLTGALVVGIIVKTLHRDSVLPPARILLTGDPAGFLRLRDPQLGIRIRVLSHL